MDLKEERILGHGVAHHWYYRAKVAAVQRLLGRRQYRCILDAGAGSGFFSRELLRRPCAQEAICVDTGYPGEWLEIVDGKPIRFVRTTGAVPADLLLMMDVLEHVEDDISLLGEYAEKIPSGANVLITVPAFSFLWSGHDIFLEHRRRYRLRDLENVTREVGFVVEKGCYFFAVLFPFVASLRLASRLRRGSSVVKSDLKEHHPVLNSILLGICHLELPFMALNRAFGLSAFCLAKKC
jgi:hypothetical protein